MLMISGVGPSKILEQYGIPVISNLQGVGQNMWDHFLFGASYQVTTITHSALGNPSSLQQAVAQYRTNGSGLLGNPGGDLLAWEKFPDKQRSSFSPSTQTSLKTFPPDWPEVEYLILDAYSGDNENYITGAPHTPYMYASPAAAIVVPQSRGNVSISSADSADPPIINPNWLSHPADQELAIAAFKRIRELMATEILKNVTVGDEIIPGPKVSTDAGILDAIKKNGIQAFHASATCKPANSSPGSQAQPLLFRLEWMTNLLTSCGQNEQAKWAGRMISWPSLTLKPEFLEHRVFVSSISPRFHSYPQVILRLLSVSNCIPASFPLLFRPIPLFG